MTRALPVFLLILLLGSIQKINAQLLPPNQPEQDRLNALVFCGTSFTTNYAYQGIGLVSDLTTTPCSGGEGNTVWLKVSVNTPGDLIFKIIPAIATDDYDFAVIKIPGSICGGISSSDVIRCNYNNNQPGSNVNGIVGLDLTSTLTTVAAGTFGSSYLQKIDAQPGDVYLVMVNNFGYYTGIGGPTAGFTIDFAGSTALFNQPQNLRFAGFVPYCDKSKTVTLELNDYVQCSSIAADGSDFLLSPSGIISSAVGLNCSPSSGFTKQIKINFATPLPNGTYTLKAKKGTDLNTLKGICGDSLHLPDSIDFYVGLDNPIAFTTIDSPACQDLTIHFNTPFYCSSLAANGTDYKITGPSTVNIASAIANNCACGFAQSITLHLSQPIVVDGIYNVISQVGSDNNTLLDSCNRVQSPGDIISFKVNSFNGVLQAYPNDSVICNLGSMVNLHATNAGTQPTNGFNYLWKPAIGITNPNSMNTTVQVQNMRNYYVLETVDGYGCYLRDSVSFRVQPFSGTLQPQFAEVCIDDPQPLIAAGGVSYAWYDNASLTGTPANLDCSNCYNPKATPPLGQSKYYVLITDALGCLDTLMATITVNPKPTIIAFPEDTTIKYGSSINLSASGGELYFWSPVGSLNDNMIPNPTATPKEPTHYVVTGANQYGCISTDTCIVNIDYRVVSLVPNAFTPNNDGLNDFFKIEGIKYQKILTFRVFDRYGEMVYDALDVKGWDGNINGKPAASDVYFYFIQLGYADNYVETIKGDVTLLR